MRHQRIVWWVFAVNLIMGGLGASGIARALGDALHHSLAGERLANGFDVGMFVELVVQPDVRLFSHSGGMYIFAALYFLFLLFIMPGIISVYLQDRKFSTGEFFGAAGSFFWAFVRLALWSLIPFFVVNLAFLAVREISDYMGDRAVADQTGFYILVVGCIPVLLLFVWVRLWFDLAQVRSVSLTDRVMRRNAMRMFRPAMKLARGAYASYLVIGVLVWLVTIVALGTWSRMPARAVPITFLLLEIIMLAHIFGRLWQKACATTWYNLNAEPVLVVSEEVAFEPVAALTLEEISVPASDIDAPLAAEVEPTPEPPPPAEPEPPNKAQ